MKKVPRINLMNKDHVNADYGNFTLRNKDSYLTTSAECRGSFFQNVRGIVEVLQIVQTARSVTLLPNLDSRIATTVLGFKTPPTPRTARWDII